MGVEKPNNLTLLGQDLFFKMVLFLQLFSRE